MNEVDKKCFEQLKKELGETLKKSKPEISTEITQWKSKEIVLFQDDLLDKVSGRISEKWFYTHIKSSHVTLPRIDILDLLSKYIGRENWSALKNENLPIEEPLNQLKKPEYGFFLMISLLCLVAIIFTFYKFRESSFQHNYCFIDTYSKLAITEQPVDIVLLSDLQSPRILRADPNGCLSLKTKYEEIKFVIRSPYYTKDTILRNISIKENSEKIELKPNDYAMIIHLFSNGNVSEWESRRKDLEEMFHDNAKIYQVFGHSNNALAIYNKQEFISKLILPTGTLKNLEILDTVYKGDQIALLRFKKGKNEK